jgi:hypothetical protein
VCRVALVPTLLECVIRCGKRFESCSGSVQALAHVRETFESAVLLGAEALRKLGTEPAEIAEIGARIRARDQQPLELESVGGLHAGRALFSGRPEQPIADSTSQDNP